MILLVFGVFHTLWITDFHIELYQVFILLIVSGIFTCWKHVYRMFKLLGTLAQQDSSPPELLYPEYGSMSRSPSFEDQQDHPPKYEECAGRFGRTSQSLLVSPTHTNIA